MELTTKEIRKIHTKGNNVLIKLDRLPNELNLKSGKKLYIDPGFEPEKNAAVTGSVVAAPSKLTYSRNRSDLMPWKTEMELKVDDKVVCYFMSSVNAFEFNKWIKDENGGVYIFVKYEHVYIARRKKENIKDVEYYTPIKKDNGFDFKAIDPNKERFVVQADETYPVDKNGDYYKIIPLNGYCVIEPVRNEEYEKLEARFKKIGLRIPPYVAKKNSIKYGIVKYLGKPNEEYWWNGKSTRDTDDGCDIKIGDKIVMRRSTDISLEYGYHASLEGRKKFFRVQRRYIMAVA